MVPTVHTRITNAARFWECRASYCRNLLSIGYLVDPDNHDDFEREVYGRIPNNAPKVTWQAAETREIKVGATDVIEKQLQGHVDNSACPAIEVNIAMTLATPKAAKGPVPVLMMFSAEQDHPPSGARKDPHHRDLRPHRVAAPQRHRARSVTP